MTKYDMLIDAVNQKLYEVYKMGQSLDEEDWDDEYAGVISHEILEIVEEFQQSRSKNAWRASD